MPEEYTNYTTNYPNQAAWLVYINGLEIPVSSVTVDFGVNKIPTCTFDMPPDPRLTRLGYEDRIEVVVFYLDCFYDAANYEFRLMGEYDIMGWAYTNSPHGRSLRFMAVSPVQIFQQLNMYYISSMDDIVNAYLPPQATDAAVQTDVQVFYPASLFLQGLMPMARPPGDKTGDAEVVAPPSFIQSPYQFIRNIFKAMLSDVDFDNPNPNVSSEPERMVPKSAVSAPGKNFFARYMARRDLYRRFAGLPYIDDTSKSSSFCFPVIKAAASTEALKAIQSQIGSSIGQAGNVWDLLRQVLGTMLMEISPIPAPPIGMADKTTGIVVDTFKNSRNNDKDSTFGVITANIIKPQCYFGLPPTCNIIFPSMITSLTLEEDYTNQPTRIYLGEQFLANYIAGGGSGSGASLITSTLTTGFPPVVKSRMSQYMLSAEQNQNTKNFLIWPEEFFRGPVSRHLSAPPWLWMLDKFRNQMTPGAGKGLPSMDQMSKKQVVEQFTPYVEKYCKAFGVPKDYVWARMYNESNFTGRVLISGTGAIGWMQLMPDVIGMCETNLKVKGFIPKTGTFSAYDPEQNIMGGIWLISWLMKRYKATAADLTPDKITYNASKKVTKGQLVNFAYGYGHGNADKLVYEYPKITKGKHKGEVDTVHPVPRKGGILSQAEAQTLFPANANQWSKGFETMNNNLVKSWAKGKEVVDAVNKDAQQNTVDASSSGTGAPSGATGGTAPTNPKPTGQTPDPATTNPPATDNQGATEDPQEVAVADGAIDEEPVDEAGNPISVDPDDDPLADLRNKDKTVDYVLVAQYAAQAALTQQEIEALSRLFDYYAMYEYYRARYESRVGAVMMAFNPYVIPAFPTVIFDSKYSGISTFGYVLNVTHHMSAAAGSPVMSTTVNTAFQRTVAEALGDLKTGWDNSFQSERPPFVGSVAYPIEPITDVANIFQDLARANWFYGKLLYNKFLDVKDPDVADDKETEWQMEANQAFDDLPVGAQRPPEDIASGYRSAVAVPDDYESNPEVLDARKRRDEMQKNYGSACVLNFKALISMQRVEKGKVTDKDVSFEDYTDDVVLKVNARFDDHFRSYDKAISYVSRPACTLRQYIALKHNMSVEKAIAAGYVAGPETSFYSYATTTGGNSLKGGATFWARIYKLDQGPGSAATQDQIMAFANVGPAKDGYRPYPTWTIPSNKKDPKTGTYAIPQTRNNWDTVLEAYRVTVRTKGIRR